MPLAGRVWVRSAPMPLGRKSTTALYLSDDPEGSYFESSTCGAFQCEASLGT